MQKIKLPPSWESQFSNDFSLNDLNVLSQFLEEEKKIGHVTYPSENLILSALSMTPFDCVKVVILGQDPYHGAGQAHGLSFSVPKKEKIPPSLKNIYKEIEADLGIEAAEHGNLTHWASQGVLLLNSVLTVRQAQAGSHQGKGWEKFTDNLITLLNNRKDNIVFMLWGNYAQKKGHVINPNRHYILSTSHPSPLSAHRGFLGCKHFSKCNAYLQEKGKGPIDWSICQ